MNLVKHFDRNRDGRDFVVGDVHGCFDLLSKLLEGVKFDPKKDRLFSVGDLVDRGGASEQAIEWLEKPWFHAVRGNHEQMAIDFAAGMGDENLYRMNGGSWFLAMGQRDREAHARMYAELPVAIEVETLSGLIGIVHADPVGCDWPAFVSALDDERVRMAAMWSRQRIQARDDSMVEGVTAVIVGHTILKSYRWLGNVCYIDTGSYATGKITMVELCEEGLNISTSSIVAAAA